MCKVLRHRFTCAHSHTIPLSRCRGSVLRTRPTPNSRPQFGRIQSPPAIAVSSAPISLDGHREAAEGKKARPACSAVPYLCVRLAHKCGECQLHDFLYGWRAKITRAEAFRSAWNSNRGITCANAIKAQGRRQGQEGTPSETREEARSAEEQEEDLERMAAEVLEKLITDLKKAFEEEEWRFVSSLPEKGRMRAYVSRVQTTSPTDAEPQHDARDGVGTLAGTQRKRPSPLRREVHLEDGGIGTRDTNTNGLNKLIEEEPRDDPLHPINTNYEHPLFTSDLDYLDDLYTPEEWAALDLGQEAVPDINGSLEKSSSDPETLNDGAEMAWGDGTLEMPQNWSTDKLEANLGSGDRTITVPNKPSRQEVGQCRDKGLGSARLRSKIAEGLTRTFWSVVNSTDE